jgi:hypothetical protein
MGWKTGAPLPRLLIMTVATHREPFIDLVEHSVEQLGSEFLLHVVGVGGVFTGCVQPRRIVSKSVNFCSLYLSSLIDTVTLS